MSSRVIRSSLHQPSYQSRLVHLPRSEEHTSELQSLRHLVCRLLLGKKEERWGCGEGPQATRRHWAERWLARCGSGIALSTTLLTSKSNCTRMNCSRGRHSGPEVTAI